MCPLNSASSVMIIALGLDDMYDEVMVNKHHNVDYMEGDRVVALTNSRVLTLRCHENDNSWRGAVTRIPGLSQ